MPKFNIVNDPSEIDLNPKWITSGKFNSKDRVVDEKGQTVSQNYAGRTYVLFSKMEKKYTGCERFQRGFVGTLAVVFSLGFALFSKSVSNLFTKDKKTMRFGIDPIRKQLIDDYTPKMIKALGGVDKVMKFPLITNWDGDLMNLKVDAPISRGTHGAGSHYLLFKGVKFSQKQGRNHPFIEYLRRENGYWAGVNNYKSQLNLRVQSINVKDGSAEEKHMLDRIQRLVNDQPIGKLKRYPGVLLIRPADKSAFMPKNAYLKGQELTDYMDLDTLFYERKPADGCTDLFLSDPSKTDKENEDRFKSKFPKQIT